MNSIKILDCTLRDGGYINNFQFGLDNIIRITDKLCEANIDIIECGFLRTNKNDVNFSLYGGVEQIYIPENCNGRMFVAMIEFGGMSADAVADKLPGYIDGIRLTFHNKEWDETKILAQTLMDKGYHVFIQPVGTAIYTDVELLTLMKEVSDLEPYAFYLVDTLGSLFKNDLWHFVSLIDKNLKPGIALGFHSHNNLQLSFSNAMDFIEMRICRDIIIDSSVFGMGRGAGNLSTELITHYINKNIGENYKTQPVLELIDEVLMPIYHKQPWGYQMPYCLAAIHECHPNYASYLIAKAQITIPQIAEILNKLPNETRHLYKSVNIDRLYYEEMRHVVDDKHEIENLRTKIGGRTVLVIAPGGSANLYTEKISEYIAKNNPFVITVNFSPENITPDLIFSASTKRYLTIKQSLSPIAVTSNIKNPANAVVFNYDSLISSQRKDNSGIMVLRLLVRLGLTHAALAGYDGFRYAGSYYSESQETYLSSEELQKLNIDMAMQLGEIGGSLKLDFITPTMYTA